MNPRLLISFFLLLSLQGFGQERIQLKDTVRLHAELLDFDLGGTCGFEITSGLFVFKVTNVTVGKFHDKKFLGQIRCAGSIAFEDKKYFLKGNEYEILLSKIKVFQNSIIVDRFLPLKLKQYDVIDIKPLK